VISLAGISAHTASHATHRRTPARATQPDRELERNTAVENRFSAVAEGLEQAQAYWITGRSAGRHAYSRYDQAQVAAMFAEEKPALLPLPVELFSPITFMASVRASGRLAFEVEAAYYGAPPGWIGPVFTRSGNATHVG